METTRGRPAQRFAGIAAGDSTQRVPRDHLTAGRSINYNGLWRRRGFGFVFPDAECELPDCRGGECGFVCCALARCGFGMESLALWVRKVAGEHRRIPDSFRNVAIDGRRGDDGSTRHAANDVERVRDWMNESEKRWLVRLASHFNPTTRAADTHFSKRSASPARVSKTYRN